MTRRGFCNAFGLFAAASTSPAAVTDAAVTDAAVTEPHVSAKASGFRMPLESMPHERSFMQWPARAGLYGNRRGLAAVQACIASIANTIVRFEPVVVLAGPDQMAPARQRLDPAVDLWPIETEDMWSRDSGPTFVQAADGTLAVSELNFNGWGDRQPHTDDARIARRTAARLDLRVFDNGLIGEGGGVETDGAGTLMAHESSWENPNRNRLGKAEIERKLLDALGAERMIWAPGVAGADITDYHIDALARFVKPGQVVIQMPDRRDPRDPWSVAAFATYDILKQARDATGRKLDIVVMREPNFDRIRSRSRDLVCSYVNYYVCNGAVVGAAFGDAAADDRAYRLLEQLYPGRTVVNLNVDPIAEAGGGIRCVTQQQPARPA